MLRGKEGPDPMTGTDAPAHPRKTRNEPTDVAGFWRHARLLTTASALFSLALGCIVLVGWSLDLPSFKSVLPGFVSMKANTAAGFLLSGASLLLLVRYPAARNPLRVSRALAALVILLGVLTLGEYLLGTDLGLDQLLFQEPAGTVGTLSPGRMAPITAINFALMGAALVLGGLQVPGAHWLSLLVALGGLLPLLGYLYGAPGLFGIGHYTQMALHTAVAFVFLGLGGGLLNPEAGPCRLLGSASPAGNLLRRVVPVLLTLPLVLGYIWVLGERRGYFEGPLGAVLAMLILALGLLGLLWWSALALDRIDTLRRQAELRLRESAQEIRATLYGLGDGVLASDPEGRVLHMNPVAEHLTGWTEPEAIGRPLEDVFRIIHEDTQEPVENPAMRVLREGRIVGLANHTLLIARDGTRRAIADSGAPVFDEQGNIARVVLVFRDQTAERTAQRALRSSEGKHRRLHESMRDAYVLVDMDGRIQEHNRLYQEMLGYSEEELQPLTYLDLTPPEWHAMETRIVQEQILSRGYSEVYEKSYRRKDGSTFPVELRTNLLTGEFGEPLGMWAIVRDISERKRAEEEIRLLNEELEQRVAARTVALEAANRELEAFAYSVSHDLRAPLRHTDGFLSMLARHLGDRLDEKGAHYLRVAQLATLRMGQLVEGLLSFSRLGRTELRVATIDAMHLVASVLEEFKDECGDRTLHWRVGALPALHGDPTLLRLVLQNLVGNALKFTRNQPTTVIEIQAIEGLTGETGLCIRDNGVGFDPAYTHKLFGVFQRLHREEEFEGTGIGLANVHRIISRHGGRVWAESQLGQGAAFFFVLPDIRRQP
jgi:PAS domain S-box-containing protein